MRTATPWPLPSLPTSTATLLGLGVSQRMIRTRLEHGDLLRLRQGIYLARSAWPEHPAAQHLVRAHAEVAANPLGVLSHQSAAIAWGLPSPAAPWHERCVSITFPAGCGLSGCRGAATHHVAALPGDQLERDADGYAVTGLARTAVDLSARLSIPDALVLCDAAARRLCARFVVEARRTDYANPRLAEAARAQLVSVAGTRRATSLLPVLALVDPARESPAESLSAGHFHLAGLPAPEFQAAIRTPAGTFFPDCLWREQRVIGECDGALKYADQRAFVQEKRREQVLLDQGFRVVRWLAEEIMFRPAEVIARVERALGW